MRCIGKPQINIMEEEECKESVDVCVATSFAGKTNELIDWDDEFIECTRKYEEIIGMEYEHDGLVFEVVSCVKDEYEENEYLVRYELVPQV